MRRQDGIATWAILLLLLLLAGGGWSMYIVDRGDERGGSPPSQLDSPESCTDCGVNPVPEPGASLLFAVGGLVVGYALRHKGQ